MPAKVLVIDNYDSFVYNLVQYLAELGAEITVIRNDEKQEQEFISWVEQEFKPSHILISPGPGRPEDSKLSLTAIQTWAGQIPILGVCLGCQAIGELFGSQVVHAPRLMHGKTSTIEVLTEHPLFHNIPSQYTSTRYHSLVIERQSLESNPALVLDAIAADDGTVMAISHSQYPNLMGVQYHPESILSEYGHQLLQNFLNM